MSRGTACVLLASLACAFAEAADLRVEIDGIEGELLDNARAALELAAYEDRAESSTTFCTRATVTR